MTKETLKRAKEIEKCLETIGKLHNIINHPYPHMFEDKVGINGFCYNEEIVSFVDLDNQTNEDLKKSIFDTLSRRREELEEELNGL